MTGAAADGDPRPRLRELAASDPQRIVFTDRDDPRVSAAVTQLAGQGLVEPLMIDSGHLSPLEAGLRLLADGEADGLVGGAAIPTSDVLVAAAKYVGRRKGVKVISSSFLMVLGDGRPVQFADCGVVLDPDARKLSEIALASAATFAELTGSVPKVAMLSFSTLGSGDNPSVAKVREAVALLHERSPELTVDGELQFDAAFAPAVGRVKAPGSPVAGAANVFVFPDLNSGNIGYKIAERIGGATALGPLLQGFAAPVHDLSRGCSTSDVVDIAVIAAVQAINRKSTAADR